VAVARQQQKHISTNTPEKKAVAMMQSFVKAAKKYR
jgi:hypothetical protein